VSKEDRFHKTTTSKGRERETRSIGERDRDRVLYTSALRRLAEVTQVVSPYEGHVFHNRLTHSLEVAQIARRLAERLLRLHPQQVREFGGIDPDVAEAAGLAHDLGHPPFGHAAEEELDKIVIAAGAPDGFEGNAQSFRILTVLAAHRPDYPGLNLTRGTLNAVLKYPWLRRDADPKHPSKFGSYRTEEQQFAFARQGSRPRYRSLEAAIMDHADAVAYSVHDLDDFFRAGLVPLEALRYPQALDREIDLFRQGNKVPAELIDKHRESITGFAQAFPLPGRYTGVYEDRMALRAVSATLIHRFVVGVELGSPGESSPIIVPEETEVLMRFLQNLVWRYVIQNPSLGTLQEGQRKIVRTLFHAYLGAIRNPEKGEWSRRLLPTAYRSLLERREMAGKPAAKTNRGGRSTRANTSRARLTREESARMAADIVASHSEPQAIAVYRRALGFTLGSIHDSI
jgi:dGTPase